MDPNEVYNLSMDFSQKIWDLVQGWPAFAKETNGRQIVRSADSVSATLKEGFGRYFYKIGTYLIIIQEVHSSKRTVGWSKLTTGIY